MPRDIRDSRDSRENGRKRRYSDVLEDLYRGPQEFMEAGVRGFLITSIPDREEHAIDETVKVLRKTCVKLYGGIKPLKREDASFAKGYIMVDFMDPETVVCLTNPDAEQATEEDKAKADEEPAKEEGKDNEAMEEENKQEEEVKEDGDAEKEKEKAEGDAETTTDATKESKAKEEKDKEERKKREDVRRRREEDKKPLMLASHKFQAYRTELRNIMFIKSDIPDPVEVVTACYEMMLSRKPLFTDCVNQLLPVQGVCENDYKQLEIMCRRVLVPYVGEQLEEAPSFGVMLINKMCEPGAEVLLEVVRSAVWGLNPSAWQCSPWAEPDVVIHVEIIGSKIILSAMPHYMKYRQYSPFAVHELGPGRPEDEEKLLKEVNEENNRDKDRGGRGSRGRDRRDVGRGREDGGRGREDGGRGREDGGRGREDSGRGREDSGRGRDRDEKKKPQEKEPEKKEDEKEASKESENVNPGDSKEQAEDGKEEKPAETTEEKKATPEKRSTRGKSDRKSKS